MALSLNSLIRKSEHRPPRITVYGVPGVGKTSFAAGAPDPVFIPVEDGLGSIEVDHFPLVRSYEDLMDALGALASEDHNFKTVVIDSLDWAEPLVWAKTCQINGWKTIEDANYGKGFLAAAQQWREYIDAINYLRDEKGMTIIQIAHSETVRFDSPETEPYSRYTLKLHKRAAALIQEHSDILGFANYRTSVVKAEAGFNKKVTRGVGTGERLLYLAERPAFTAKQRYGMPDVVPLDWNEIAACVPFFTDRKPNLKAVES